MLDRFPRLRVVANYGAGYDGVDVDAARDRGIVVTNTPGVTTAATAELAVGLMLALRRRIVVGDSFVRSGRWGSGWADEPYKGEELAGSTVGIVGFGRIGQAVAARVAAFEAEVIYTRRTPLDDIFAEADVVSIHLPLTDETRGLVDAGRLARMRDGAVLINTARGQIVDEAALVAELRSGRLQAGLDVFAHEPEVPSELLDLPNVVMTPHLGTATQRTREAMTRVLVDNLLAVERGQPPPNAV